MKKISKNEMMAYIFFIIINFFKGIGLGNTSKIYLLCYLLGVILVFFKLFTDKFTKKEVVILGIILILGLITFFMNEETTVLFTAIALICLKNVNIKRLIKIIFWTRLVAFLIAILLPLMGITEMNTYYFYRASLGKSIMRYSFLYSHPNLAHASFSILIVLWGYIYFEKVDLPKILVMLGLNYLLYYCTFSRAGFLVLSLYIIVLYLAKKIKILKNYIPKILNLILILSIIISFLMAWGYGRYEVFTKLNSLFTGRLRYMNLILNYNPPIFGGNLYSNIKFDNGYFDMIYNCGILSTLWYFILQIKTNKYIKKESLEKEGIIVAFFIIYNIIENHYASIVMNISLLFFAYTIYNQKSETELEVGDNLN